MVDHQTVGGGPFAPGAQAIDPIYNYKNAVVYCAQAIASAQCAVSQTGGIIFNPAMPSYTTLDCGGLHGHVKVGPDGTMYLPNKSCLGGQAALVVSADNGLTWTVRAVPGSTGGGSDPAVDIGPNGTVYFSWTDANGHAYATASNDKGQTWSQPVDIGAPVNVVNSQFTSVVAGDDDRAAVGWLGTQTAGDDQSATFPGAWHLYVAFTYDRGRTWTTYDATPGDPVQRGCIWNGGGSNPCRNLLDFNGITMDKFGRVLAGYADGCIDDPLDPANKCVSNPPGDVQQTIRTSVATIARQSGGKGLIAKYDGQIFKSAPGAPILSGLAGNSTSRLTWTEPSNNGAAITGYKIFRGATSGAETLVKTVGAVTSFDDTSVTNGIKYYYQVSAVNGIGESAQSNEVVVTPQYSAAPSAPQRLHATAKKGGVLLTWGTPSSSGTATITNYRIYRGTLPGTETLLGTSGNTTKYEDAAVKSGATYYYFVKAVNSVGEGSASNEVNASVK
jgi:hypothetical protein